MRSPRTARRVWLFLLVAGLSLQAPLAAGQPPPLPPQPYLAPDVRSRLAEAARDSTLAPWQREFMLDVAGHGTGDTAAPSSPALPGVALRMTGTAAEDGGWIGVPPPSARYEHTAIYDPVRDRMVVFGGYDGSYRDDVWALSLAGSPAWSALAPAGSLPSGRFGHSAIYDPVRDRMLVFGGYEGSYRNDVWALSLAGSPAWSPLSLAGTPPSGRYEHTAIYDPLRDRMVVFGGFDDTSLRDDVWALSLAGSPAWTEITPAGTPPTPRNSHTAIYDPVRDRMVVFGGWDGGFRTDVWGLSLLGSPAWSALAPAGIPPAPRYGHTAIYDPLRDRMVVFGGQDDVIGPHNDVWALSLSGSMAWSALAPAGSPPSARVYHSAIYVPVRDQVLTFGGIASNYFNDVWALSLAGSPAWTEITPAGNLPTGRYGHAAIYDPVRDRMVVFGGWGGTYRNDVWALSLAGGPAWSEITPAGTPPPARAFHTAIYDPVRDRMVVFGGRSGTYRNDVWELSLSGSTAWNALTPVGSPPSARAYHTAIYDPVRDRIVVFGGGSASGSLDDVWALWFAGYPAWSTLAPAGASPAERQMHTAIYDPMRNRMVVFGGLGVSGFLNDVWALTLSGSTTWSALAPAGSLPTGSYEHTAIYDPVRDRMVVFGGGLSDTWALSLAGSPAWSLLSPAGSPPSARYEHTAIYDPLRDRMVVFGGYDGSYRNDVWALGWGTPVSVAQDVPGRFHLGAPRPNPSRGETSVDFELGEPARVVLDVFDAHGRRVKRIAEGWFPAGRHASTWRGDDDYGHVLGSGVYFIRVLGGSFQATRRAVRIR